MARSRFLPILACALGACTAPVGAPSLSPRAAETIDPRVPVVNPVTDAAADPALAGRLERLVGDARAGESAFASALGQAQRLAASAGTRESDSWIEAQEALSAAIAARAPTTRALGDIDAMAAAQLERDGRIGTGDYLAIQEALREVAAIDARQSERIRALQRRLGG